MNTQANNPPTDGVQVEEHALPDSAGRGMTPEEIMERALSLAEGAAPTRLERVTCALLHGLSGGGGAVPQTKHAEAARKIVDFAGEISLALDIKEGLTE